MFTDFPFGFHDSIHDRHERIPSMQGRLDKNGNFIGDGYTSKDTTATRLDYAQMTVGESDAKEVENDVPRC